MLTKNRLETLRTLMQKKGIDAYIDFGTDPHLSEYLTERWKTRAYISGFTGSAGVLVITAKDAGLWTDGRYYIQADTELFPGIELYRSGLSETPKFQDWLIQKLDKSMSIAVNPQAISYDAYLKLETEFNSATLKIISDETIIDELWKNRPEDPYEDVFFLEEIEKENSSKLKLEKIREQLISQNADCHFISTLDDIAWIFNLRGSDIPYNPVFQSYAYIDAQDAVLFTEVDRLTPEALAFLKVNNVQLKTMDELSTFAQSLKSKNILISPTQTALQLAALFNKEQLILAKNPSSFMKACKTEAELKGMNQAMLNDGVALLQFYQWLYQQDLNKLNETTCSNKLREFRSKHDAFFCESFHPIAAYKEHAASPHYSSTPVTDRYFMEGGLLLLDTGAQYRCGTTDITRMFCIGEPCREEIEDYTLVLKGHVQLSRCSFPKGSKGCHLDILARLPLWNRNMNFGHGTGHGIGHFLNVHEGPQSISPHLIDIDLEPGMILSNEPGLYRPGKHGIRIENLIVVEKHVKNEFGDFYRFSTLTKFPYERKLIDKCLLSEEEILWIDEYHRDVYKALSPQLDMREAKLLEELCEAL